MHTHVMIVLTHTIGFVHVVRDSCAAEKFSQGKKTALQVLARERRLEALIK